MNRRKRATDEVFSEINIIPFTDICLVLLIIFMMTATFIVAGTGLNIRLPGAATAAPQDQTQVVIFVTQAGDIYLGGTQVKIEELLDKLTVEAQKGGKTVVIVSADRAVSYGKVVEVLDAVRLSGLEYLALAAELKPPPGSVEVNLP